MRYRIPKLVIYRQTYDQALDIICRYKLVNCEPESQPVQGLLFQDESDLIACASFLTIASRLRATLSSCLLH